MRISRLSTLLLAGLAACSDTSGPVPSDLLYAGNLAKWNSTGPNSYQMVLTRLCECAVPTEVVLVVVRNKSVESRTYVGTGAPVPASRATDFPDIPGLFELINRARGGTAYLYSTGYDAVYGYPATLYIDWVPGSLQDDVSYAVSEFTSLPQP
jgi:hypothetical protein